MELLNRENTALKRDKQILQAQVSKLDARVRRLEGEVTKFDEKTQEVTRQMEERHNLELHEVAESSFLQEKRNTELEERILAETERNAILHAKLDKIKSVLD